MPKKQAKSKYTADRGIPGAFEGETVTRRRFMTGTAHAAGAVAASRLPAARRSASRSARSSRSTSSAGSPSARRTTSRTTPTCPQVITIVRRHRRGRQDDGLRPQAQPGDRHRRAAQGLRARAVRRDLHALHAPRLPGPLRRGRAALHLPVPRRRLRLRRQGRRRPAGAPARPLLHPRRATASVEIGPRFSVNTELERFSPARPGEPLDGIGQYLYPSRPTIRKLDSLPTQ